VPGEERLHPHGSEELVTPGNFYIATKEKIFGRKFGYDAIQQMKKVAALVHQ